MIRLIVMLFMVGIIVGAFIFPQNKQIPTIAPEVTILVIEDPPEPPMLLPKPTVVVYEGGLNLQRITAYNPVAGQTDSDPHISSCGPNKEKQIAVSRDLFFDDNGRKHLCGARATVITDRGEVFEDYVIWDTMASRFSLTADVMLPGNAVAEARQFGVTTGRLIIHD